MWLYWFTENLKSDDTVIYQLFLQSSLNLVILTLQELLYKYGFMPQKILGAILIHIYCYEQQQLNGCSPPFYSFPIHTYHTFRRFLLTVRKLYLS